METWTKVSSVSIKINADGRHPNLLINEIRKSINSAKDCTDEGLKPSVRRLLKSAVYRKQQKDPALTWRVFSIKFVIAP